MKNIQVVTKRVCCGVILVALLLYITLMDGMPSPLRGSDYGADSKSVDWINSTTIDIYLGYFHMLFRNSFELNAPQYSVMTLHVDPLEADPISHSILTYDSWDLDKTRDMLRVMKNMPPAFNRAGSTTIPFVDVGANLGWFYFTLAAWGYRVESIEPMPPNYGRFQRSLKENTARGRPDIASRIHLHTVGLDSEPRECFIYTHNDNKNNGIMFCGKTVQETESMMATLSKKENNITIRASLTTTTFDRIIAGKDIYLMKLDCEGFEPNILTKGGAAGLWANQKVHYIVSEVHPTIDANKYFQFFADMGYELRMNSLDGEVVSVPFENEEFFKKYWLSDVWMILRR